MTCRIYGPRRWLPGVRQIFGDGCWERGRLARMQAERLLSLLGADTAYQRSVVHPWLPITLPIALKCRIVFRFWWA